METDGLFTAKQSAIQPPPMKPVALLPQQSPQTAYKGDYNDYNAVKAMTWQKLVDTLAAMPPGASVLPLAREIMDRIDGRPVQRTDARVLTQSKGEIVIKLVD